MTRALVNAIVDAATAKVMWAVNDLAELDRTHATDLDQVRAKLVQCSVELDAYRQLPENQEESE